MAGKCPTTPAPASLTAHRACHPYLGALGRWFQTPAHATRLILGCAVNTCQSFACHVARLAMIAIAGMVVQEGITGQKLF